MNKLFPIIIITLFMMASVVSLSDGDSKMFLFYFCSAVINLVLII